MFASTYIKTQGYIREGAETIRHLSMYKYLGTISSGQTIQLDRKLKLKYSLHPMRLPFHNRTRTVQNCICITTYINCTYIYSV